MAGSTPEERARMAMLTQSALDFIAQVDPEILQFLFLQM